jgi:hypothetical protein
MVGLRFRQLAFSLHNYKSQGAEFHILKYLGSMSATFGPFPGNL